MKMSMNNNSDSKSHLAILLTVHNRKEKTLQCLKSVYSQIPIDGWDIDVFLTDDGSTDGTHQAVINEFPKVKIIKGDGNLYWNRGMIKAWEEAIRTRDYSAYLWLNDDTILTHNAIKEVLESYFTVPNSILVGSTKAPNSETITYGGSKGFYTSDVRIIPNGELQKCGVFNGNFVLIPKSVYKKIGMLDPAYSHALGDTDYALMAQAKGINMYVCRNVVGICERNTKTSKWTNKKYNLKERYLILNSPLGYAEPKAYFHFKLKHWGLVKAIGAVVSIYYKLLFPK